MSSSAPYTQLSAAAIKDLIVPKGPGPQWKEDEIFPAWVTLRAPWKGEPLEPVAYLNSPLTGAYHARTNQSYLTDAGLQELANLLDSGAYQIEYPENAVLMVVVHLLRLDRVQEARKILMTVTPYMNMLRFFPTATFYIPTFGPDRVGVINVGSLKKQLSYCFYHPQSATQTHHRDGCDLYEPIQAEAIKLLLASAGTALTAETDKLLLTQISDDLKADMKWLITRYWVINPDASDLVQQSADIAAIRDPHPVGKHTRKNATTRMLIEAMCSVFIKTKFRGPVTLSMDNLSLVGNRIRTVIAKRGELGTPKHDEDYRARVELSSAVSGNNRTVAQAAISVLTDEHYGDSAYINEAEAPALAAKMLSATSKATPTPVTIAAPRLYHGGSSTGLPTVVASGISRATARTIEEHIQAGIINSADGIASVIPALFTACASNKIEDPVFRNLYCHLSLALARRQNERFSKAVGYTCMGVLPWANLMRSDIDGEASDVVATGDTIRIATRAWIDHFPHTMTPNRFVSSINRLVWALNKQGNTPAPTLDTTELPTMLLRDISNDSTFAGSFSSNFSLSTLQAARALQGTLYERYYDLGPIYADLIARLGPHAARTDGGREGVTAMSGILLDATTNCMPRWKVPAMTGRHNYTVANGRTLESVMVMSTHNLCQLYAWLGLGSASPSEGGVDNMAAARKTWKHIIGLFESPPEDTYYGYRMVAYAWRQLLFFLSMEEKRLTQADDADSIRAFRATMAALCDEMQQAIGTAKLSESIAERLSTKFVAVLRKVAAKGKVNTMDSKDGAAHGDVVLGHFGWPMFDQM